jgi:uncharacterized protein YaiE (UPF0345 family)
MIKLNEYFDGNVKSLGFKDSKSKASVGVINPGEYEFGTSTKEVMTVTSGKMDVLLPDADWKEYTTGESYEIETGKSFKVKVTEPTAYLCRYY